MTLSVLTGKPGHGKTLYAVTRIAKKAQDENRAVYYHGIPDLKLEWNHIDDPHKWIDPELVPDGAIVVIDEAQRHFPPRPTGSKVPQHVQLFDTHRHRGLDIYLITQDPMLIDSFARNLAGEHIHVLRPFGTQQAKIYRWEHVVDPDNRTERGLAVETGRFAYPKESFNLYKSATVHTVKRRIPLKLAIGLPAVLLVIILGGIIAVKTMNKLSSKESDAPTGDSPLVTTSEKGKITTAKEYETSITPRLASYPESAPRYDELAKPAVLPVLAGCVQFGEKCKCVTQQATPVEVPENECKVFLAEGRFNPYDQKTLGIADNKEAEKMKKLQDEIAQLKKEKSSNSAKQNQRQDDSETI